MTAYDPHTVRFTEPQKRVMGRLWRHVVPLSASSISIAEVRVCRRLAAMTMATETRRCFSLTARGHEQVRLLGLVRLPDPTSGRTEATDPGCPMCGIPVDRREAAAIERDMENDGKSCIRCSMTFAEARREAAL